MSGVLDRLEAFLEAHARPLEKAVFRGLVKQEPGAGADIVAALAAFQNADGGFGRGLEPDYRSVRSSVLATNRALSLVHRCRHLEAPWEQITQPGVEWLLRAFDSQRSAWPIVGTEGDREPHAPWWNLDKLEETFGGFRVNPSGEVVTWLLVFGDPRARDLALSQAPGLVAAFDDPAQAGIEAVVDIARHWLVVPGFPADLRESLRARVVERLIARVETDPERWSSYCWKPFQAVPHPQAPGADVLGNAVRTNLRWQLTRLDADGSVAPHWSWFGAFPEEWPQAEKEWRGILTLEVLIACRAWGVDDL